MHLAVTVSWGVSLILNPGLSGRTDNVLGEESTLYWQQLMVGPDKSMMTSVTELFSFPVRIPWQTVAYSRSYLSGANSLSYQTAVSKGAK